MTISQLENPLTQGHSNPSRNRSGYYYCHPFRSIIFTIILELEKPFFKGQNIHPYEYKTICAIHLVQNPHVDLCGSPPAPFVEAAI